jgi:hypothetical protein
MHKPKVIHANRGVILAGTNYEAIHYLLLKYGPMNAYLVAGSFRDEFPGVPVPRGLPSMFRPLVERGYAVKVKRGVYRGVFPAP